MASKEESNKALVMRYAEHGIPQIAAGNKNAIHEYFHDRYVNHTPLPHDHDAKGREGLQETIFQAGAALAGMHFKVDHIIAEGDWVALHFTLRGKHEGHSQLHHAAEQRLTPTHADTTISGLFYFRIEDGKIIEGWGYHNHIDVLLQTGALKLAK